MDERSPCRTKAIRIANELARKFHSKFKDFGPKTPTRRRFEEDARKYFPAEHQI